MSKSKFKVARIAVSALTATATVMTFGGASLIALAAAPADYGLVEGDTISANAQAGDPDVYIVNEHGYKRLFTNPAIFGVYGHLSFEGVKQVSAATRDAFPTSGLFRNCETGDEKVYGLDVISEDVANLRWINTSGAQAVADDADFFKKVFCINSAEMALYGTGAEYSSVNDVPDYDREGGTTPSGDGFNPNGGTAGSIDDIDGGTADETSVLEGEKNVELALYEVELSNDGPLLIQNVDVHVQDVASPDTKPWTYFNEVCVTLNGSELDCMDADSESDWNDQGSDEYKMRFTGLNGVLPSDDTSDLGVEFSANGVIDTGDFDGDWDLWVGDIRYLDESGLVQTIDAEGESGDSFGFLVENSDMADVEARTATDDIEAMVVEVDDTTDTDGVVAYRFTLEEINDVDVTIEDLSIEVYTGTEDVDQVVKKVRVMDGSTTLCEESPASGSTDVVVLCEDIDIDLDGDEKDEFTVELDLHDTDDQTDYIDGETVQVEVVADDYAATDANGNDESDMGAIDASALGEEHELRANGINVEFVSASKMKTFTADESGEDDQGLFVIVFDVTPFGDDAYIDESDTNGVSYTNNGAGSELSYDVDAEGTESNDSDGDWWWVGEDQTRRFTVEINTDANGTAGNNNVTLSGIDWVLDDGGSPTGDFAGVTDYTFNLDEYKTGNLFLNSLP